MANLDGYTLDLIDGSFSWYSDRAPLGSCSCPEPEPPTPALFEAPLGNGSNAGPDFGIDIDAIDDVPLSWSLASGYRNLGNALARRLSFLTSLLNAGLTDEELQQFRSEIVRAVMADERVQGVAELDYTFNPRTSELRVSITVDTADGPFATIFSLTPAGVAEVQP